jgi:hypothetical protein
MSDSFKRRRRRTGPASHRFTSAQLVPVETVRPALIGKAEIAAGAAMLIVAGALIALIWIVTGRAVNDQRADLLDRMVKTLSGQAATMAETVSHEMSLVDQSLAIIQAAWKDDPKSVDLVALQKKLPTLTGVTDDLFIADDKRVIVQDILPKAVGQVLGTSYITAQRGSLELYRPDGTEDRDGPAPQAQAGARIEGRNFPIYIVRKLDRPDGWLVGASFHSAELPKLFAGAAFGYNASVAMVDRSRGNIQAIIGPAARRAATTLSRSAIFQLIGRSDSGVWTGISALDGTDRIHAFRRVPDRDLVLVVAASTAEVMAASNSMGAAAVSLGAVATALVLAIGGLVLWSLATLKSGRRRQRAFERNRQELERLRAEEASNTAKAAINAARLQLVLTNGTDGIAILDAGLRLVQWNHPFRRWIGREPARDMPLDAFVREHLFKGAGETGEALEAGVARVVGSLRAGEAVELPQAGPGQDRMVLRGLPVADAGLVLLLSGFVGWVPPPPEAPGAEAPVPEPEPAAPAVIEW